MMMMVDLFINDDELAEDIHIYAKRKDVAYKLHKHFSHIHSDLKFITALVSVWCSADVSDDVNSIRKDIVSLESKCCELLDNVCKCKGE